MNSPMSIPVERGCGSRVEGGIYWDLGTGKHGIPIEDFLLDMPVRVSDEITVKNRGVTLLEREGVFHVVDRVGGEHYPNVADFIEEVRRFGLSRRLPSTLDFSKLTNESRLLLVHDRAWVSNLMEWDWWACPKHIKGHERRMMESGANLPPEAYWDSENREQVPFCCAGVWWQDVEGGEEAGARDFSVLNDMLAQQEMESRFGYGLVVDVGNSPLFTTRSAILGHPDPRDKLPQPPRLVKRTCPSFSYIARARPETNMLGAPLEQEYEQAFFASFPAGSIAVVRGHKADESKQAASKGQIEVVEVDK